MSEVNLEILGEHVEQWVQSAPDASDVSMVMLDAQDALIEAGMVQFDENGWDFKLHEKFPDAPRAQFKLMIREAAGVDTNPAFYDRFTLPAAMRTVESGLASSAQYVVGYPNAGTAIAESFVRNVNNLPDVVGWGTGELEQLLQEKITHEDGSRELGAIIGEFNEAARTIAIDDTATGGDTKIEGWEKITASGLAYTGLILIVERDPLGTALVEERTGHWVWPGMHWITLVQRAAKTLDLPADAVQREMDYTKRLFEWKVQNGKLGSLPSVASLR